MVGRSPALPSLTPVNHSGRIGSVGSGATCGAKEIRLEQIKFVLLTFA